MKNNIVYFGGREKNNECASNDLYLLNLRNIKLPKWLKFPLVENSSKPSGRYGHSMIYFHNYIIIFGGIIQKHNVT